MRKMNLTIALALGIMAIVLFAPANLQAQIQEKAWTGPQRLSNPGVESAGEAVTVADQFGHLHMFWSEVDPEDDVSTIQYTVFDGEGWLEPIDIWAARRGFTIGSYAASIDEKGILHLIWVDGSLGPIYYATAPANEAMSAHAWSEPVIQGVPAFQVQLAVKQGVLHIIYSNFFGDEPGVYYFRSVDGGKSWSPPYWLDPDIPLNDGPTTIQFAIDDKDGLHVSWAYSQLDKPGIPGHWVRYAHSLDGGKNWSNPFTIDIAEESDPDELRLPSPGMVVTGDEVHVIWAGNSNTQREHRFSLDRGESWSETQRVMGNLGGQAIGDGLVKDAAGRLHFFGQIRWPQGVYHSVWDGTGWTTPSMVYLIASTDAEGRNGRYHAHYVRAGILAGNQLLLTFTDEPSGPLYAMFHTLEDVTALSFVPTPSSKPIVTPPTSVSPTATPLPLSAPTGQTFANVEDVPNLGASIWLGLLPAAVLILGIILIQLYRHR